MAHVLCVLASPRKAGNSTAAALDMLACLHATGHTSEVLHLCDHTVWPCVACGVCETAPHACALDGYGRGSVPLSIHKKSILKNMSHENTNQAGMYDTAHEILERIYRADVVLLASPVYFYGTPAHCKALIDRSQPYWFKSQIPASTQNANLSAQPSALFASPVHATVSIAHKPAFVMLTAARLAGPKLFDASLLVLRSFMSCMGFAVRDVACLRELDKADAYVHSASAREEVQRLGRVWARML